MQEDEGGARGARAVSAAAALGPLLPAATMSGTGHGKRASPFFEELPQAAAAAAFASPPDAKRPRLWDHASPPPQPRCATADPALDAEVSSRFPAMTIGLQPNKKAPVESGNDLDAASKSLDNLHLGSVENNCEPSYEYPNQRTTVIQVSDEGVADGRGVGTPMENITCPVNLELLVNDVRNSSNMDDAKAGASRALEDFQKTATSGVNEQALHALQKKNYEVKEKLEEAIRENNILKIGIVKQNARQEDYDKKNQELQQLKQLVAQYQERVKKLEASNYNLRFQLSRAQGRSIPGHFHPDVF